MRAPVLALAIALPLLAQAPAVAPKPKTATGPFDPTRDAARDFEAARAQAKASGRRILLDVGGNWCSWCRLLHGFWEQQPEVKALRDQGFVFLMVNFSPENKNQAFLARFPKIGGYPHFFVLDAEGQVLHSQDTGALEDGKGYSPAKMTAFLKTWGPAK